MSLKKLFGNKVSKDGPTDVVGIASLSDYLEDVESIGYLESYIKDRSRFKAHTDYTTGSNFVVFGSLEEYYESGIKRIQEQYPYDGSMKEKLDYINNSSGFDIHLFEKEYPRTTGHVTFAANGVSTAQDSYRSGGNGWSSGTSSGSYGIPSSLEYIYIKGGPNIGNFYSTGSQRTSNLEINGSTGNTIEFWLKKHEYVSSKTQREVIFDAHTIGTTENKSGYGRMTVELDSSNSNKSPFYLTYQSGTTGLKNLNFGDSSLYNLVKDGAWHHYAFTFKNVSGSLYVNAYVDGTARFTSMTGSAIGSLNTPIVGTIGALATGKNTLSVIDRDFHETTAGLGYGKLSGSLDEFRFWKQERSPQQVGRFWNTQVGAGSNTDVANTSLGVYYKFNEGTTGFNDIDNVILDYSGRVTNGLWVGYAGVGRSNNSAFIESSASHKEFKDPILYKEHPEVASFTNTKKELGYAYDLSNNSSLYYTMPSWIVDEDVENGRQLRKVTQIVASYFDSLYQQIKDFKSISERKYHDFDNKPHPFNDVKLEAMGLVTPELFLDTSNLNLFLDRSEDDKFKEKIHDVKNFIYNNIYNNLEAIFKSKGTEKSFRNLFRCFGVDNELIKINLYSTDSDYPIEESYSPSSTRTKYVNFSTEEHTDSSVIQTIDGLTGLYRASDAIGYVTGAVDSEMHNFSNFATTTEAQVFFPPRYNIGHPFYFPTPLSSSILGCHSVRKKTGSPGATDSTTGEKYLSDGSLLAWPSSADDLANFQLYAVKDALDSRTAKFVLKSRNNLFDPIETPFITDIYDSNRWNVAVKVSSEIPFASSVSGSAATNQIELIACKAIGDSIESEYHITKPFTTSGTAASAFIQYNSSGDQLPVDGNFINLISAQGTSKRYEFDSNGAVTGGSISVTIDAGSVTNTYTNLMNAVNASTGHNGEIVASFDASDRKITFTQTIVGDIGETEAADSISNATVQCHFQGGINSTTQNFANASKRFYLGAHRKDFDDQLDAESDVKIANFRHWLVGLSKDEVRKHAIDPRSYGLEHPSRLSFPLTDIGRVQVPQIDLLAINWDFSNLTGSNKTGQMWINDVSSGSLDSLQSLGLGKVAPIVKKLHPAKGINFAVSTTASVDVVFDSGGRLQPFENVRGSDMVKISLNDDIEFTRETKPTDYYFSFEKSMYSAISDEMLNFFAGVNEFSNLIGAPVERYRQDYKAMGKLRQIFFDRIQNEPDIERYLEYYKWLDSSLSIMIDQLVPASVASSDDIQNVIESHILERNKYQSKYPTIEFKQAEPIGSVTGINELLYDWQHGHAPFDEDVTTVSEATSYSGTTTITIPNGNFDASSLGFTCGNRSGCDSAITLNDGSNTRVIYVTMNINDYNDGFQGGDDIVGVSGNPSDGTVASRLVTAINGSNNGAVNITAAVTTDGGGGSNGTDSVVTLTHDSGGEITITYASNSNLVTKFVKPELSSTSTTVKAKSGTQRLWKRERAQRNTDLKTPWRPSDADAESRLVDPDREIIRRVINTSVSGTNYVTRRLSRPYRFTIENQRHAHGGSTFFGNAKRRFYSGITKPSHITYIAITGSEIQRTERLDEQRPNEKKKWSAPADISHTSKDHDSDLVSPFSLYSSSLDDPKDYHAEIFKNVKKGVEISNLHSDAYGDDGEITLQSPFTEKFVGGSQFRHVELNRMRGRHPTKNDAFYDSETTRFEGFRLFAEDKKLYVLPPNAHKLTTGKVPIINESYAVARYLREPLAKRPVNIKNIKVNSLGNYTHVSDIVQYSSPEQNRRFLVNNSQLLTSSVALTGLPVANLSSKLRASDAASGDSFGAPVAISGDYAIVGAQLEDHDAGGSNGLSNAGSAYIFKKQTDGTWSQIQKIVSGDREVSGFFGSSADIDGDYAVVGAYNQNSGRGAAYIFLRTGDTWAQQAKIVASTPGSNDLFGWSVAISGDTVVVGARGEDEDASEGNTASAAGSAYVFTRDGTSWSQQQKIVASDRAAGDYFGYSVDISGETIIVGANLEAHDAAGNNSISNAGSAYVFTRSGSTWSQQQKIVASDRAEGHRFGRRVAIHDDVAVVGAPGDGTDDKGQAYVFTRSGTTWTERQVLAATDGSAADRYGSSVAVYKYFIAIGARDDDTDEGSVYLYDSTDGTTWSTSHLQHILNPTKFTGGEAEFGHWVALSEHNLIVGAPYDDEAASDTGTAYIYDLDGTTPLFGAQEFSKLARTVRKNVFVPRFSAPGGTEVAGDSRGGQSLDRETNLYSVYNTMNYRNLSVRGPRNYLDHLSYTSSVGSTNLETDHKVYSNPRPRKIFKYDGSHGTTDKEVEIKKIRDNRYVSHPIPQNDYQYSWITASLRTKVQDIDFPGHLHSFTQASLGAATGSMRYERTYEFLSASTLSSYTGVIENTIERKATIVGSDLASNDDFGVSVAISGDTIVVGAELGDGAVSNTGAAYVFITSNQGTTWSQQAKLLASDEAGNDSFGEAVAISGDYIIVGAWQEDHDTAGTPAGDDDANTQSGAGSAYIFKRTGTSWAQTQKIVASDRAAAKYFGDAVSISGDYAAVGAWRAGTGGAVYIFKKSGETWSQTQILQPSDAHPSDQFGRYSVVLSSDASSVFVGGLWRTDRGAVYVFTRSGETWSEAQKIEASDKAFYDEFGRSVALSGDYLAVGAPGAGGHSVNKGAAYVFKKVDGTWTEQDIIVSSDVANNDQFGTSIAILADTTKRSMLPFITNDVTVIVGAVGDDDDGSNSGSVYVFRNTTAANVWTQTEKITAPNAGAGDDFGRSIAAGLNSSAATDYFVVGEELGDDAVINAGSAHVYTRVLSAPQKHKFFDFAGLNTHTVDFVNINTNMLTSKNSQYLTGTILHRQGPYGWPSWKQIRGGESQLGRSLRRNNIYAPIMRRQVDSGPNQFSAGYFSAGNYSWPTNIEHRQATNDRTVDTFADLDITLFKSNFIAETNNTLPDGFVTHRPAGSTVTTGPRVKAKTVTTQDPAGNDVVTNQEAVLALIGTPDSTTYTTNDQLIDGLNLGNPRMHVNITPKPDTFRFVAYNKALTSPLTISYEFIVGSDSPGLSQNVGLTDSLGFGSDLFLQYKIGESGQYKTLHRISSSPYITGRGNQNIFIEKNDRIDESSESVFLRWVSISTAHTDVDHWGIKNIRINKLGADYRFEEPPVTINKYPIKTIRSRSNDTIRNVATFSYSNNLTNFANKELAIVTRTDLTKEAKKKKLKEKSEFTQFDLTRADMVNSLFYREGIFPRENNTFLKKSRGRVNFKLDFWKEKHKDRIKENIINSQGETISRLSIWPLDAQENFKTVALRKTTDRLIGKNQAGTDTAAGSGELFAEYSIFHNNYMIPSASALYARPFPLQTTSSLPAKETYRVLELSASYSNNMQPEGPYTFKSRTMEPEGIDSCRASVTLRTTTQPDIGDTITLISTQQDTYTFTAHASDTGTTGGNRYTRRYAVGSDVDETVTNFVSAVNLVLLNHEQVYPFTATKRTELTDEFGSTTQTYVDIVQNQPGADGNTTVGGTSLNSDDWYVVTAGGKFTGGSNVLPAQNSNVGTPPCFYAANSNVFRYGKNFMPAAGFAHGGHYALNVAPAAGRSQDFTLTSFVESFIRPQAGGSNSGSVNPYRVVGFDYSANFGVRPAYALANGESTEDGISLDDSGGRLLSSLAPYSRDDIHPLSMTDQGRIQQDTDALVLRIRAGSTDPFAGPSIRFGDPNSPGMPISNLGRTDRSIGVAQSGLTFPHDSKYVAWVRTTSSYQFPGVIKYHLNSSDGQNGARPPRFPLYVQVGNHVVDDNGSGAPWTTVGVITGSAYSASFDPTFKPMKIAEDIHLKSDYIRRSDGTYPSYDTMTYHPFEHVVTASIKGHVRFVAYGQDGDMSEHRIAFLNIYKIKERDRDIIISDQLPTLAKGLANAAISEIANSSSLHESFNAGGATTSGQTISTPRKKNTKRTIQYFYTPQTDFSDNKGNSRGMSPPSVIDFKHINNYADIRYTNIKTPGIKLRFEETSGSYDFRIIQSSSVSPHMIYAKNEKLDNCLWGSQFYKVPEDEARNPFNYSSYQDFSYQSKLLAKGYSILPEFRISEHMNHYIDNVGGEDPFFSCRDTFLTLTGALGDSNSSNTGSGDFYRTYSHTEFLKHFEVIEESIDEAFGQEVPANSNISPSRLTLTCKAFKKFLPYKGFYPADRMTQLAAHFSSSYNQHVTGGHWRNVLAPYYAPGIGFNSVKSGIAVDYPVFEPQEDRTYNQYGVMFQSASLLADFKAGFSIKNEEFTTTDVNGVTTSNISGPGDSLLVNSNTGYAEVKNGIGFLYCRGTITDGDSITIVSLDGTSKTYTARENPSADTDFDIESTSDLYYEWAPKLLAAIQASTGHNGKVVGNFAKNLSATPVGEWHSNLGGSSANNVARWNSDVASFSWGSSVNTNNNALILIGVKSISIGGTFGGHENDAAGGSTMAAVVPSQFDCAFLSKNRVEIGDGSSWAQALTGSDFTHDGKFATSFWMYLPSTNEIDSNVSANNPIHHHGKSFGRTRLLGQRGVVLSLGSGNDTSASSWRKGLHLTYQVSPFMDNTSETKNILKIGASDSNLVQSDGSTPDTVAINNSSVRNTGGQSADFKYSPGDKSHVQIYFQLFGGDGINYFCWQSGPGASDNIPLVDAAWARPGWNHFYIEADLEKREIQYFKVFRNGHQYTTAAGAASAGESDPNRDHGNAAFGNLGRDAVRYFHSDYDHTNGTSTRTEWATANMSGQTPGTPGAEIKLDGTRNCFVGNHLGNVQRINEGIMSGSYSHGQAILEVIDHDVIEQLSDNTTIFTLVTTDGETVTFKKAGNSTSGTTITRGAFEPSDMGIGSPSSNTDSKQADEIYKAVNAHPKFVAYRLPGTTKIVIHQMIPGSAGNTTITNSQSTGIRFMHNNKFVGADGGLGQYHYSEQKQAVIKQGLLNHVDRSNAVAGTLTSQDGLFAPRTKDFLLDFLKPSEFMLSEMLILNKSLTDREIKGLSGVVRQGEFETNFTGSFGSKFTAMPVVKSSGRFIGPSNPYSIISKEKHDNIVAWYRFGNDTGYNKKTTKEAQGAAGGRHATTNDLPVFNHAQPLHSGKVITAQTNTVTTHEDENDFPIVKNFLSGTFYGFTDWSGSIANDLAYSDKYRQRWNGIVDISNPDQYTYIYHSTEDLSTARYPDNGTSVSDAANSMFKYKTWRFPILNRFGGRNYWTIADFGVEKDIQKNEPKYKPYVLQITGAIKMPSYIQGSKFNFTDDASIPRIGSASYGTSHFTGSGLVADDTVYSRGWKSENKSTGIRRMTRIPFEAIISPESFTPSMTEEDDAAIAEARFYDIEPHPSASLNGMFFRNRRFVGIHQRTGKDKFVFKDDFDPLLADGTSEYLSNERYAVGIPKNSGSNLAVFDLESAKTKKSVYNYAANNFYAECINFFLSNQKGVTIRSSDELKEAVKHDQVYEMQIELNRGNSPRISKDNTMYNNPAAFGPPVDAGKLRSVESTRPMTLCGYGFAPYTPPHYDQLAKAIYTFTPSDDVIYDSIESVLRDTNVRYVRRVHATGSISANASGMIGVKAAADTVPASYNRKFAMHLSESFYGLDAASETAFVQSYDSQNQPISGKRSLVIQTKFECPTFDFSKVGANRPRTDKTIQHLPTIKGVWHQSGDFESDARPKVSINTEAADRSSEDNIRSLASLLGMRVEGGTGIVGELAERREISEAVVAIPFITRLENGVRKKKFFKLPEEEVYQAVRNLGSYPTYKQLTEQDLADQRSIATTLDNLTLTSEERRTLGDGATKVQVRDSVAQMVKNMLEFNIPPQLNFLKYNDKRGKYIAPFAMYIFPFRATLTKEDLARIWQNTTPDIGLDFGFGNNTNERVIQEVTVSHELFAVGDLLNPEANITITPSADANSNTFDINNWTGGMQKDLQWMVFKVKQKAETDFFRKKELDRLPDGHPEKIVSVENDKFACGFNWPYDYFSLVELINLDAEVEFKMKDARISTEAARSLLVRKEYKEKNL